MDTTSSGELRKKRSERILCLFWGYGPKRPFAETRGIPKTERLSVTDPIMTFCSDGYTANIVGCGSAFCVGDEVDQRTFPDTGFSCNDDVTNGRELGASGCVSPDLACLKRLPGS